MRDHEDRGALEALILELLLEGDQSAEEIAGEFDARMASVLARIRCGPDAGTEDLACTVTVRVPRARSDKAWRA
jgi:hypothetical protein